MSYCPNGHGEKAGRYCPDCGAELIGDESVNIRGAKAVATANPTFVLPGGHVDARPALVKCPWCGQRKPEHDTFDCQGECSQQNLCLRHFDEEYEVCKKCAELLRGTARQEAARQAKLHMDLTSWRERAEQAEARVVKLSQEGLQAAEQLDQARASLLQAQNRVHVLEEELAVVRRRAETAEANEAELSQQNQITAQDLDLTRVELRQEQAKGNSLEQDLIAMLDLAEQAGADAANLTQRSQKAESDLAQQTLALDKALERVEALEKNEAQWRERAVQAESSVASLSKRSEKAETELEQQTTALGEAQQTMQRLELDVLSWRSRAAYAESRLEEAEGFLAEIEQQRQRDLEEARRRAAEEKTRKPIWQQLGFRFVDIPAGNFLYGPDKSKVYQPGFSMASMPVTNAQYLAFVQATGYSTPMHWYGEDIPAGKEDHPVVHIGWHDAKAFCQWAGSRLPTEKEWEKAARGTDGREYPWGDQVPDAKRCNFNNDVSDTTPVGQYPSGASAFGLLDMPGNVWEWCEDSSDDERGFRVVRGGSWYLNASFVRVTSRDIYPPDSRYSDIGFRVVLQA